MNENTPIANHSAARATEPTMRRMSREEMSPARLKASWASLSGTNIRHSPQVIQLVLVGASSDEQIVPDNVVLELKDDSPSGKLLVIQVDMRYESRT